MNAFIRLVINHRIKFALLCVWLVVLFIQQDTLKIISEYFAFFFLGITGAIFANTTGAGGGVVFVPFFNQLSMSTQSIVATSFAIQCCGMTAGAVTWFKHYKTVEIQNPDWQMLPRALALTTLFSVAGIGLTQYLLSDFATDLQGSLHLGFGIFSILLAIAIYASIPLLNKTVFKRTLIPLDYLLLAMVALAGGIVTAWLSVGVGELVAVYLILRGFSITFAIGLAVILSAFTVWSAIPYHIFVSEAVYYQILLFAGAGAIIGGLVAKSIVMRFSIIKLKIFFATWVMIMGIAGLPLFS